LILYTKKYTLPVYDMHGTICMVHFNEVKTWRHS